jgi:hypothetical protein
MVARNPNAPATPADKMNYKPSIVRKRVPNTGEPPAVAVAPAAPVAAKAVAPAAPAVAQGTVFESGLPIKANQLEVPKAE